MEIEFRYPELRDQAELARKMSDADRVELLAQGVEPEWAISHSIEHAKECVAIIVDGELACITGLTVTEDLGEPQVYPWLLGTDKLIESPRLLLKYTKTLLDRWRSQYSYMWNYVDARHTRAISWLGHFGAQFEYIPAYGIYRRPFFKFTFGEEQCASQL